MAEIRLVSGVITDIDNHVLLMQRLDHNQWELPGGRIEDGEMALGALARVLHDDLGLMVTGAEELLETPRRFTQGEAEYTSHWFRITGFRGTPFVVQSHLYGELAYHNILGVQAKRRGVSPNIENLIDAINQGVIDIRHKNSGTIE